MYSHTAFSLRRPAMSFSDIVAVQWGLLGLSGVVVALLIPKATDALKDFSKYGGDREWRIAARFSSTTRWTPVVTLIGLMVVLSVGMTDKRLGNGARSVASWL